MKTIIQDLIGIVLSIGVLLMALKAMLKKGADLYRYAVKISKEIKTAPKRQQNISAEPKKRRLFARIWGSAWFWFSISIAFQVGLLAWEVARPTPLSRMEVMRIAMDSAALVGILVMALFTYIASRWIGLLDKIVETIAVTISVQRVLIQAAANPPDENSRPSA